MKTKEQIQKQIQAIKRLDSICDPNDIEYRRLYEGCIDMLEWVISKEPITHIDGHGGECIVWDYDKEEYVRIEQQPQSTGRSEQFKRLSRIQESGYNVVNCGNCGIPVIVSIDSGSDLIECHECGFVGEHCDYPDVVCEAC